MRSMSSRNDLAISCRLIWAGKRYTLVRKAANVRCSVLNGERADVPEDIVVDSSLRFPRSATATGTPESLFQCGR